LSDYDVNQMKLSRDNEPNLFYEVLKEILKKYGICSFSKCKDHILLWSHYAHSHQGICLGFNPVLLIKDNAFLFHVTYESEGKFKRYRYDDDVNDALILSLIRKSIVWDYESESRIIHFTKTGRLNFLPESLVEIIFGMKTKKEDQQLIREIIKDKGYTNVTFKRASPSEDSFSLDFIAD